MDSKEIFNQIYEKLGYDCRFEDYLYNVFLKIINELDRRLKDSKIYQGINYPVIIQYLAEEHAYNMHLLTDDFIKSFIDNQDYFNHLVQVCTDKIFFNEFHELMIPSTINPYNPLITTLSFYINIIMREFNKIKKANDLRTSLMLDMLRKVFYSIKSILVLITDGFEVEAFANWRTVHEIECVIKILDEHEEVSETYLKHMDMSAMFKNKEAPQDKQEAFFTQLKEELKKHDLKSKDMKKYLEYGWLYGIIDYQNKYPELRLNFRNGVEYVAGLNNYTSTYEACSEISHGSAMAIYASTHRRYYRNRALISAYESFIRMEDYFFKILKNYYTLDDAYVKMRSLYIPEVIKNELKIKLMHQLDIDQAKRKING